MVLKRILAHKREENAGGWKKFYSKKCHDWYFTSCVIRLIKTGTMRWVEHVARMGEEIFFLGATRKTRMNDIVSNSLV
jgi:hypothetical protein